MVIRERRKRIYRKRIPYGMVTIDGTYQGMTKFIIPNEVVRDYIHTYLLDACEEV